VATPTPEPNRSSQPVLLLYAHPDDESFGCAGTIALLRERDVPVVLVSATRGEAGGISDATLATPETLGEVREAELRAAMALVGVSDVRFLGYRDSGMIGTAENDDPRALAQAANQDVARAFAEIIREVRPSTVLTFGPDGIYGHPDHLAVHRAASAAVTMQLDNASAWQIEALYYNAAPRERIKAWSHRENTPFFGLPDEALDRMGTPAREITHVVDVSTHAALKRQVLGAHRTQVSANGPMADLPPEVVQGILGTEQFVRQPLPWDPDRTAQNILDTLPRDTLIID